MSEKTTVRCFVALDLPLTTKEAITGLCEDLKQRLGASGRSIKWVRPDGMHLTLKFLGDVPAEQVSEIKTASSNALASIKPFELKISGLGCFPKMEAPRVIWLGLGGNMAALNHAQQQTEKALNQIGFEPEKRAYSPHVTLARVLDVGLDEKGRIGRTLQSYKGQTDFGTVAFDEAVLMESDLRPSGAIYTPIAHFPFAK